jgi:hypothetical protein
MQAPFIGFSGESCAEGTLFSGQFLPLIKIRPETGKTTKIPAVLPNGPENPDIHGEMNGAGISLQAMHEIVGLETPMYEPDRSFLLARIQQQASINRGIT